MYFSNIQRLKAVKIVLERVKGLSINPQKAFEVRLRLFFKNLLWICVHICDKRVYRSDTAKTDVFPLKFTSLPLIITIFVIVNQNNNTIILFILLNHYVVRFY